MKYALSDKINKSNEINGIQLSRLVLWVIPLFILMWALIIRLWDIKQLFIGDFAWNEVYYAYIARSFFDSNNLLTQIDLYTGSTSYSFPLVPWVIYGSFKIFGIGEWQARLPMLFFGIAALVTIFLIVRTLYGNRLAVVSLFLASVAPGIIFFSRNVQLDGVMTTLGFMAILTLIKYQQNKQFPWLVISVLLFSLAILAKYTAILFAPALAWIWLDYGTTWRAPKYWVGFMIYLCVALLPAILWITLSDNIIQSQSSTKQLVSDAKIPQDTKSYNNYFIRTNEWTRKNFQNAFLSIWSNSARHLGNSVWFLGLFLILFASIHAKWFGIQKFLHQYGLPLLIILPWYLQIGFPSSWIVNEYYDYAALYGMCILLGAMGIAAFNYMRHQLTLTNNQLLAVGMVMVVLIVLSNTWDYRVFFHGSYYPWPLVNQPTPQYSAQQVANIITKEDLILTDLPFTFYYTQASPLNGRFIWWGDDDANIIKAIKKRKVDYIVFIYPPTIDIINAINESNYERIAPAAWQRQPINQ